MLSPKENSKGLTRIDNLRQSQRGDLRLDKSHSHYEQ